MEDNEELKTKINYKTSNEIWGKVLHVKGCEGFENRHQALDLLVNLGFEAWKNDKQE